MYQKNVSQEILQELKRIENSMEMKINEVVGDGKNKVKLLYTVYMCIE